MGNTAEMSKESRAALRSALKSQLAVVRKKVRTMRAKNLMGISEPDEKEKTDDDSSMDHRKADRRGDHDRDESPRSRDEGKMPSEGGSEGLSPGLKSEALDFFQKGNKPKVGKTRSVVARVMTSEQKSFSRDSKPIPPKGGKKK